MISLKLYQFLYRDTFWVTIITDFLKKQNFKKCFKLLILLEILVILCYNYDIKFSKDGMYLCHLQQTNHNNFH